MYMYMYMYMYRIYTCPAHPLGTLSSLFSPLSVVKWSLDGGLEGGSERLSLGSREALRGFVY